MADDGAATYISATTEVSMSVEAKVHKTNEEWRKELTPEQYHITREHGTERPWSHVYNTEKRDGMYYCVGCGAPLFSADTKFESGSGWPSFFAPIKGEAVGETTDRSLFATRTEVHCANCGAHLGHVFPDGPKPTGQRYCMNGCALDFKPAS
jgi:peptide-methionine (R)-S-oxide reductase